MQSVCRSESYPFATPTERRNLPLGLRPKAKCSLIASGCCPEVCIRIGTLFQNQNKNTKTATRARKDGTNVPHNAHHGRGDVAHPAGIGRASPAAGRVGSCDQGAGTSSKTRHPQASRLEGGGDEWITQAAQTKTIETRAGKQNQGDRVSRPAAIWFLKILL